MYQINLHKIVRINQFRYQYRYYSEKNPATLLPH
jgi:hypothetical protein